MVRRVALLLLLLAPLAVAQSASLQSRIDATPDGGVLRLEDAVYGGPATIGRGVTILGVDQRTSLVATGAILTVDSGEATVRFLRFSEGDVGVLVRSGALARLGPAMFERVEVAVRAESGAIVLMQNDPSIPARYEVAPGARFYFSRPGMIEATDAATGARVGRVGAALVAPDGATLATYPPIDGLLEIDAPFLARSSDGRDVAPEDGLRVVVRAEGYHEETVPVASLRSGPGAPAHRLALRSTAPPEPSPVPPADAGAVSAASTEATTAEPEREHIEPSPSIEAPPLVEEAPLESTSVEAPSPAVPADVVVAATVAASAVAAGAAAATLTLRSERRLWKFLALFAPLYSRLKRGELLDDPTRERIFAHVNANPGVRYRELQRALAMKNGALAHHLQILLREGLLRETREGHAVRFHAHGAAPGAPVDTGERVLLFIRGNPGATGLDVARGVGVSSSLAGYHLQRLDAAGRIERRREGFRTRAYAREIDQ